MDEANINELIRDNKVLLVEEIIKNDAKVIFKPDDDGRYPLHWAVSSNNPQIVDIILRVPDIDIDEMIDNSGWLPLHIASSIGNMIIFDKLINLPIKPDINLTTNQGTNCLLLSISKNHYNIVSRLIVDLKANIRAKDNFGRSGLHRASAIGSLPICKLLVESGKVNINGKDNQGWTCLHYAMAEGHPEVAIYLIEHDADVTVVSDDGETPEQVANKLIVEAVSDYFQKNPPKTINKS